MHVSFSLRRLAIAIVALVLVVSCGQREADYSASDVRLAQDVRAQLDASPETKGAASWVVIEAKNGTVTLSGSADTAKEKETVEQAVARTTGVKNVVNHVTVSAPALPVPDEPFEEQGVRTEAAANGERIGQSTEDARIYQAIRRQLVKQETTPKRSIFVDVENGDVTLRGTIFTDAGRNDAVTSARSVEGVKAVSDRLVVNTPLP